MRKLTPPLHSAKFVHGIHLAIIAGAIVFVPLTTAQTVRVVHQHHSAKPQVTAPVVAPAKKTVPVTHAAAKPVATSTPVATAPAVPVAQSPAPVAKATPAPGPAPSTAPSPAAAAVAASATSPGTGVHTLTPSSNPPPSSGGSSSTTSSSSSTSSSTTTSSSGTASGSGGTGALSSTSYTSYNWAGYMASSESYTGISGNWTVPTPTGNNTSTSADATWIGIGGTTTQDLIQVGSEDTVSASGSVNSAVFYELLPASPVYPATITINSGDSLSASLSEQTSGTWLVSITDTTNGQNFRTTVSYSSSHSSAEWIEEDPSYSNGQLVPLDTFSKVPFSGGTATTALTQESIAASHAASIALVNQKGATLAAPSALSADGNGFSVIQNP